MTPKPAASRITNTHSSIIMKITSIHLITLSALLTGCHPHKAVDPQRNVARVVKAESLDSAKVQPRSEYIAMLKGDVETELSFKVGGILELIGRSGETQDWQ